MSSDRSVSSEQRSPRRSLLFKILRDHQKGCAAIEQTRKRSWTTPWSYLNQVEYRDGAGRLQTKNPSRGRRWWLVGCNCIGCPALATIEETSILEGLPRD